MRLLPVLLAAAIAGAAEPAALAAKPIQIISCSELPVELPYDVKPMQHKPGFRISYLVTAADLIGFKEDSLVIGRLATADGRNLAANRLGKPTCELGSFPKVTEDGRCGVFELECSEAAFGSVESLAVAGSVVALTGSDLQHQEVAFAVDTPSEATVGSFAISFGSLEDRAKSGLVGGGKDGYLIRIMGNKAAIANLAIVDGEQRIKPTFSSGGGGRNVYGFAKPAKNAARLAISYWKNVQEVQVVIGGK